MFSFAIHAGRAPSRAPLLHRSLSLPTPPTLRHTHQQTVLAFTAPLTTFLRTVAGQTRHPVTPPRSARPPNPSFCTMTHAQPPRRVVVTRKLPEPALKLLRAAQPALDLDVWPSDTPMPRTDLLARLSERGGADALLCVLTDEVDAAVLDAAGRERLRVVSTVSVGFNHVDVIACAKRGVLVGNTPDVLTETTADTAVGLVLAASRRFKEGAASVVDGTWGTWSLLGMCGVDVHGATVGIVGLGRIGAAVARRLKAFNCKIVYSGRKPKPDLAEPLGATFLPTDELLRRADVVMPLCPLNAETQGMFDKSKFKLMKPSAVFINAARGELVNQDDLCDALTSGQIFAAGLDVTTPEPIPATHPLTKLPNCFIVPHIGSASTSTRTAMAMVGVKNALAALNGEKLISEVKG